MARPTKSKKDLSFLSQAVKDLRAAYGMSQQQFSNMLGMAINTIARYETGRTPDLKSLSTFTHAALDKKRGDLADLFHRGFQEVLGTVKELTSPDELRDAIRALRQAMKGKDGLPMSQDEFGRLLRRSAREVERYENSIPPRSYEVLGRMFWIATLNNLTDLADVFLRWMVNLEHRELTLNDLILLTQLSIGIASSELAHTERNYPAIFSTSGEGDRSIKMLTEEAQSHLVSALEIVSSIVDAINKGAATPKSGIEFIKQEL